MKEIRSVKEQYQIKDACLKERLELILPKVMKNMMLICGSVLQEYNEDPLAHAITPANYPTARNFLFLLLLRG